MKVLLQVLPVLAREHGRFATIALAALLALPGMHSPSAFAAETETGLVLVQSQPAGADVVINDVHKGKTPVLVTDLPRGDYRVRFSKPGFFPVEKGLTIADRTPTKVEAVLLSNSGVITITSTPPGANVTVNGAAWGQTPCTATGIEPGTAEVLVSKPGYLPYRKTLAISSGDQLNVVAPLEPAPGSLVVHSVPENGIVYVNNERRGNAPLVLENLPAGDYRVRVELPGYEPLARYVNVGQASQAIEEFRLELNSGSIELRTHPAGVSVTVDGVEKGMTESSSAETADVSSNPLKIETLTPGPHTVLLSKRAYESKTMTADVTKGAVVKLVATLRKRVMVRTGTSKDSVYTGFVEQQFDNGDMKLEVHPGVFRLFKKKEIISCEAATEETLP